MIGNIKKVAGPYSHYIGTSAKAHNFSRWNDPRKIDLPSLRTDGCRGLSKPPKAAIRVGGRTISAQYTGIRPGTSRMGMPVCGGALVCGRQDLGSRSGEKSGSRSRLPSVLKQYRGAVRSIWACAGQTRCISISLSLLEDQFNRLLSNGP